ncbi:hypothetical protein [Cellulomonas sp. URHB0016]
MDVRVFGPAFVGGLALIVIGLAMWRKREAYARFNREMQNNVFGSLSTKVQRASTPKLTGRMALGACALGAFMFILSFFPDQWAQG